MLDSHLLASPSLEAGLFPVPAIPGIGFKLDNFENDILLLAVPCEAISNPRSLLCAQGTPMTDQTRLTLPLLAIIYSICLSRNTVSVLVGEGSTWHNGGYTVHVYRMSVGHKTFPE